MCQQTFDPTGAHRLNFDWHFNISIKYCIISSWIEWRARKNHAEPCALLCLYLHIPMNRFTYTHTHMCNARGIVYHIYNFLGTEHTLSHRQWRDDRNSKSYDTRILNDITETYTQHCAVYIIDTVFEYIVNVTGSRASDKTIYIIYIIHVTTKST